MALVGAGGPVGERPHRARHRPIGGLVDGLPVQGDTEQAPQLLVIESVDVRRGRCYAPIGTELGAAGGVAPDHAEPLELPVHVGDRPTAHSGLPGHRGAARGKHALAAREVDLGDEHPLDAPSHAQGRLADAAARLGYGLLQLAVALGPPPSGAGKLPRPLGVGFPGMPKAPAI